MTTNQPKETTMSELMTNPDSMRLPALTLSFTTADRTTYVYLGKGQTVAGAFSGLSIGDRGALVALCREVVRELGDS
jgi:hypothetical protein